MLRKVINRCVSKKEYTELNNRIHQAQQDVNTLYFGLYTGVAINVGCSFLKMIFTI